jgi:hypothetical protein
VGRTVKKALEIYGRITNMHVLSFLVYGELGFRVYTSPFEGLVLIIISLIIEILVRSFSSALSSWTV